MFVVPEHHTFAPDIATFSILWGLMAFSAIRFGLGTSQSSCRDPEGLIATFTAPDPVPDRHQKLSDL